MSILHDATSIQLELAAAHNHAELFSQNAECEGGGTFKKNGLTWTYSGAGKQAMVAFPSISDELVDDQLDEMMAFYRKHLPSNIGCWSLHPPEPSDIGTKLMARGFQHGFQPGWMAIDLHKSIKDYPIPERLIIHADNSIALDDVKDLPYAGSKNAVSASLLQKRPERVQQFVATIDGQVVGHCCIFFNQEAYGTGGIYSVGVIPSMRNRGIGKAVVTAACNYAKEKGFQYAVLNGTGRRMYEQIGFRWIGNGLTWWLINSKILEITPTRNQNRLFEAIAKGDITSLNKLIASFSTDDLSASTPNGMTLMQVAVHFRQPTSGEWLINHGVFYTVLDAWDMRWRDRAAALLASDPNQVNQRYKPWDGTILHMAIERNDTALAQLALSANPDLEIKDSVYNSTALGWAQHLRRVEIVRLIHKHIDEQVKIQK